MQKEYKYLFKGNSIPSPVSDHIGASANTFNNSTRIFS